MCHGHNLCMLTHVYRQVEYDAGDERPKKESQSMSWIKGDEPHGFVITDVSVKFSTLFWSEIWEHRIVRRAVKCRADPPIATPAIKTNTCAT